MFQFIKQIKAKVLSKRLEKTLSEASYLVSNGYERLYGWKMEEAKLVAEKIACLRGTPQIELEVVREEASYPIGNFRTNSLTKRSANLYSTDNTLR